MLPPSVRAFFARHGRLLVDLALCIYALVTTARHVRKALARPSGQLENLGLDLEVSDFESFYRCALRMQNDVPMYFTDSEQVLEQPSKQAPFFELLLQPFVPFGAPVTIVVAGIATLAMLLHGLRLARGLLETSGAPAWQWAPYAALGVLLPTLHLNFLYFQTGVLLVWLFLLGLSLWPRRPLLAGVVWSLGISIKVIPAVFLAWLVWRRQWRATAGIVLGLLLANGAVFAYLGIERGTAQYRGYVHMLRTDPAFGEYNERYQSLPSLLHATLTPRYESKVESSAQSRDWNGVRNFLGGTFLAPHRDLVVALAVALVLAACALVCRGPAITGWRLYQEGGLVAVAMLLVSPHTWRHYYWWLWPAVVLAVHEARARRPWAIAVVAIVVAAEMLPRRGILGSLASSWQVFHGPTIGAVLVFTLLSLHLWRTRQTAAVRGTHP